MSDNTGRDDPGQTHYSGDDCPGGHRSEEIPPVHRTTASIGGYPPDFEREAGVWAPYVDPTGHATQRDATDRERQMVDVIERLCERLESAPVALFSSRNVPPARERWFRRHRGWQDENVTALAAAEPYRKEERDA